jgi:hypothetical protein
VKGGRADGGQFTLSGAVPWMRVNPMSGINLSEPGSRNFGRRPLQTMAIRVFTIIYLLAVHMHGHSQGPRTLLGGSLIFWNLLSNIT